MVVISGPSICSGHVRHGDPRARGLRVQGSFSITRHFNLVYYSLGIYSAPDSFLPLDFCSWFFPVVGADPSERVNDPPAIRLILTHVGDTYRRFGHKVSVIDPPSYTHD